MWLIQENPKYKVFKYVCTHFTMKTLSDASTIIKKRYMNGYNGPYLKVWMVSNLLQILDMPNSCHAQMPFLAVAPILYPLKTPGNQRYFDVFRRCKMETLARNELLNFSNQFLSIKTAGCHIYKRFIDDSLLRLQNLPTI